MRLFFGLPFPHQVRRDLLLAQKPLVQNALKGNFTSPGNFHLTLAFLGEVNPQRLPAAFAILEETDFSPLTLTFNSLRCFEGGIWYLSPAHSSALMAGQARLAEALRQAGFPLEERPYVPHLTLGRKISLREGFTPVLKRPIPARSEGPRLFLSHRVEGVLTYTPLTP